MASSSSSSSGGGVGGLCGIAGDWFNRGAKLLIGNDALLRDNRDAASNLVCVVP